VVHQQKFKFVRCSLRWLLHLRLKPVVLLLILTLHSNQIIHSHGSNALKSTILWAARSLLILSSYLRITLRPRLEHLACSKLLLTVLSIANGNVT